MYLLFLMYCSILILMNASKPVERLGLVGDLKPWLPDWRAQGGSDRPIDGQGMQMVHVGGGNLVYL